MIVALVAGENLHAFTHILSADLGQHPVCQADGHLDRSDAAAFGRDPQPTALGTGRRTVFGICAAGGKGRVGLGRGDSLFADVLTHARTLPAALIDAGQQSQDMICRVTGECRFGEALDSEMGTMVREKPGAPFLYARYNKTFTSGELEEMKKLSRKGFGMDNVDLMDAIVQAGRSYAQESVDLGHFE